MSVEGHDPACECRRCEPVDKVREPSQLGQAALTKIIDALRECPVSERRNTLETAARFYNLRVRPRRGET